MKFDTTLKLFTYLVVLFAVTSCLSPEKINKAIQMSESQQLHEKYKALFDRSLKNKKSDLEFMGVSEDATPNIVLFLETEPTNMEWQEVILNFQKTLRKTNTKYNAIEINEPARPSIVYTEKCLIVYFDALTLLEKNLDQIKMGKIKELYQTMDTTNVRFSQIEELFDYLKITHFGKEKLMIYPSDDYYTEKRTVFKLHVSEKTNLFFSYFDTNSGTILRSIDLNDIPIENNFLPNL